MAMKATATMIMPMKTTITTIMVMTATIAMITDLKSTLTTTTAQIVTAAVMTMTITIIMQMMCSAAGAMRPQRPAAVRSWRQCWRSLPMGRTMGIS